jgi:hypothetical protein
MVKVLEHDRYNYWPDTCRMHPLACTVLRRSTLLLFITNLTCQVPKCIVALPDGPVRACTGLIAKTYLTRLGPILLSQSELKEAHLISSVALQNPRRRMYSHNCAGTCWSKAVPNALGSAWCFRNSIKLAFCPHNR